MTQPSPHPVSILVQGTADWDQPIATNQHYMTRELATLGEVEFVESLGLRRPRPNLRDVRRAASRFGLARPRDGDRTHREQPASVSVISPKVVPIHSGPVARANRRTLQAAAATWAGSPGQRVYWTYSPVTYGLESHADAVVYHCVDLLGTVDGIPPRLISRAERDLAKVADVAIGSSPIVVEHLREVGFKRVLSWPNVADVELIQQASSSQPRARAAVFAGNLSRTKVDFGLLRTLLEAGVELHLAGPVSEGGDDSRSALRELERAGASYHGMLQLGDLADLYWQSSVGLIPYVINPYTTGVNPLKTYEYLAAGLAVVSTPVPAVAPIDGHVFVEQTHEAFVSQVKSALKVPSATEAHERSEVADGHSWTGRGVEARALVEELLSREQ